MAKLIILISLACLLMAMCYAAPAPEARPDPGYYARQYRKYDYQYQQPYQHYQSYQYQQPYQYHQAYQYQQPYEYSQYKYQHANPYYYYNYYNY